MVLHSSTEDRLRALHQVLEEKLVRRQVSLKALDAGKIEEATKGTVRQHIAIKAGISADHAKRLNKFIKDLNLKGVSSQAQGDQLRVTGKKRDDLQAVIQALKDEDFGIPLQFTELPGLTPASAGRPAQRLGPRRLRARRARPRPRPVARACVEELVEDQELPDPQQAEGGEVGPEDDHGGARSGGGCARCVKCRAQRRGADRQHQADERGSPRTGGPP